MGDHPPISPVKSANHLHGDELRMYNMILRQFLLSVSPDSVSCDLKIKAVAKFNEITMHFSYSDSFNIEPGFKELLGDKLEIKKDFSHYTPLKGKKFSNIPMKIVDR
jgi:DNA topoisomerase IA